ncbi:hypothetical protein KAZ66_02965 [Candidatus Woesebacteria bacterium]|nr:hypothetical protein [Candidatus Woesebacteria bacterium]
MRRKLLWTLGIAVLLGMFLLPPTNIAKAATVYCRNGDSIGLVYNNGLHSYVQFNVGYMATKYGYNWGYSPHTVRISGTTITLNTSLWPVDPRYSYVRIGVQGNGLVILGGPRQFRMCWTQSF